MGEKFISSIWNFSDVGLKQTNYLTHDFLRWYGKLIPQLVSKLINLYSLKGDTILANFAGSGTVLVEANINERKAVGIDSSPLSNLLCRVKTTSLKVDSQEFLNNLKEDLDNKKDFKPLMDEEDKKWFYAPQFRDIFIIKERIFSLPNKEEREFYLLALASIINKVSKVDSRCINHIVVDKNKRCSDVFTLFSKKLKEMESSMKNFLKLKKEHPIEIYSGDARELKEIKDDQIDFTISHPPYLGCINYSNIYKLPLKIMGFDYGGVRENDLSTTSLNKYMENMKKVFDELYRVTKKEKYAAVIIGDNRVNGNIIPTFSYFIDYATQIGFKLKDIFVWVLSQKAGMSIKRRGNHIDHNYILIFQKD